MEIFVHEGDRRSEHRGSGELGQHFWTVLTEFEYVPTGKYVRERRDKSDACKQSDKHPLAAVWEVQRHFWIILRLPSDYSII